MRKYVTLIFMFLISITLGASNASALEINLTVGSDIINMKSPIPSENDGWLSSQLTLNCNFSLHSSPTSTSEVKAKFPIIPSNLFGLERFNNMVKNYLPIDLGKGDYVRLELGYLDITQGWDKRKFVTPESCKIQLKSDITNIFISTNGCTVS